MRGLVIAGTILAGLVWAAPGGAATTTVNCAHANLQNKIDAAVPGSTLEIRNTCVGQFTVAKNLKLVGDPTAILDGDRGGRTLSITSGNVVLKHLVVQGGLLGTGVSDGAGIHHSGGNLTLRHVTVIGNKTDATGGIGALSSGAGIFSNGSSLTILDSLVKNNIAKVSGATSADVYGGGIYCSATLKIIRSVVRGNKAVSLPAGTEGSAEGGGLFAASPNPIVKDSWFNGNLARVNSTGGGVTAEGGGLVVSNGGSLDFEGSKFTANRAAAVTQGTAADAHGGGIYAEFMDGLFKHTRWTGNTAHADSAGDASATGAGGSLTPSGDLELFHTRVSSNSADSHGGSGNADAAGGGFEVQGLIHAKTSTFDANVADAPEGGVRTASGGGLAVTGGLRMSTSTVSRNQAAATGGQSLGGGLLLDGSLDSSITNSTLTANQASGNTARGGGVDSFANVLNLVNATVARNSARLGGGLYKEVGTTTLRGTILAANNASDSGPNCGGGDIDSAGRNLISKTAGCTFVSAPSDLLNKGAKLGALGHHGGATETITLRLASPAINAIPAADCAVKRDQRGVKRPQGRRCDIGALELKK
jgi:hypothetical protein